jgi:hypothetical protein
VCRRQLIDVSLSSMFLTLYPSPFLSVKNQYNMYFLKNCFTKAIKKMYVWRWNIKRMSPPIFFKDNSPAARIRGATAFLCPVWFIGSTGTTCVKRRSTLQAQGLLVLSLFPRSIKLGSWGPIPHCLLFLGMFLPLLSA